MTKRKRQSSLAIFLAVIISALIVSWRLGHAGREPHRPIPSPAAALGDLSGLPPVMRAALEPDPAFFQPIRKPLPGEWLAHHAEPGQAFLEYTAGLNRGHFRRGQGEICLLPLGDFGPDAPALEKLRAYCAAFFGRDTRLLVPVPIEKAAATWRMNRHTNRLQWLTGDILNWLRGQMPAGAFATLAVTMEDLYPADDWNYVFGQATLTNGVGVFSFARYDPAFHGEPRGADTPELILRRSCKVLSHEMGHLFGLYHCVFYECVMNGSNHLRETDSSPMHLCPVCLRKLQTGAGFDIARRETALHTYFTAEKLLPEAEYTRKRLAKIAQARTQTHP